MEAGFEVVVEPAQRVEFVQAGVPGLRPGFLVVVFDPPAVTAVDRTGRVGPQQGDLLRGGRPATQMSHIHDVDPVGDDQFEDGVAEQVPGDRDRDGADAGDLAQFLTLRRGRGATPAASTRSRAR